MIKSASILALFFLLFDAMAQPFDNQTGNFNLDEIEFEAFFIRSNKISSVSIDYSKKLPGSPIQDLSDKDYFKFDHEGRKIEELKIRTNRLGTDSVWTKWHYEGEKLIQREGNDRLGRFQEKFEYYASGECLISMTRASRLINQERIKTETVNDTLEIARYYNSDNIHFKTIQIYHRADGRIHEKSEEFHFSGRRNKSNYEYEEKGWVSICYKSSGDKQECSSYDYTDLGELLMVKYYKDQKVVETLELLYDDGLPEAWISKEIETNRLKIAKFNFEHHP